MVRRLPHPQPEILQNRSGESRPALAAAAPHSLDQTSADRTNCYVLEVFEKCFSSCGRLGHCSLFGHHLHGGPTGSPTKGRMRQMKESTTERLQPLPLLPPLPDVSSQRPCIWPVLAKQPLHGRLDFHELEEVPGENLQPLRVP